MSLINFDEIYEICLDFETKHFPESNQGEEKKKSMNHPMKTWS